MASPPGRLPKGSNFSGRPPLAPLHETILRLERGGVACALGGSGLLMAFGLAGSVRDWDLTTDLPIERVRLALGDLPHELHGPADLHADSKLRMAGGMIELIVGFAIRTDRTVVRLPTRVSIRWRGTPVGSPEVWAAAYALMGRSEKSSLLFGLLADRGADPSAIAVLLEQPLPRDLAARLDALPRRAPSGPG